MKGLSVKVKITIWYTLLMILMAALLLVFLVLVSGSVTTQTSMDQLDQSPLSVVCGVSDAGYRDGQESFCHLAAAVRREGNARQKSICSGRFPQRPKC